MQSFPTFVPLRKWDLNRESFHLFQQGLINRHLPLLSLSDAGQERLDHMNVESCFTHKLACRPAFRGRPRKVLVDEMTGGPPPER